MSELTDSSTLFSGFLSSLGAANGQTPASAQALVDQALTYINSTDPVTGQQNLLMSELQDLQNNNWVIKYSDKNDSAETKTRNNNIILGLPTGLDYYSVNTLTDGEAALTDFSAAAELTGYLAHEARQCRLPFRQCRYG